MPCTWSARFRLVKCPLGRGEFYRRLLHLGKRWMPRQARARRWRRPPPCKTKPEDRVISTQACRGPAQPTRLFALFPLPGALFFSLLPIVLAPAVFRRGFKALHCKRRRISIADRLYFFSPARPSRRGGRGPRAQFWQNNLTGITAGNSTPRPTRSPAGSAAGTRGRCPRERRSRCPATPR
jgi:hypothetical protein